MGLTTIRLGSVTERRKNGVNNWLVILKENIKSKMDGAHYRRSCFIRSLLITCRIAIRYGEETIFCSTAL